MVKLLFAPLCFSSLILCSCNKSNNPASSAPTPDSLRFPTNQFFEIGGKPSLNGWTYHPALAADTANFDMDAPSGGTWSLKLHKADTPHGTNNATLGFNNLASGVYELTAWTKVGNEDLLMHGPEGTISIIKERAGNSTMTVLPTGDSSDWHPLILLDTLNLLPNDSVYIMLAAGARDSTARGNPVWFDDITFKKIK